jgi:hypothetical protein
MARSHGTGPVGNRRDRLLQLVVTPAGRATLVWHAGWDTSSAPHLDVLYADFGAGGSTVRGALNPFPGRETPVFRPVLTVLADGTQSVAYDGWAMVDGILHSGHVEQHRPGPDSPWSDPVLAP